MIVYDSNFVIPNSNTPAELGRIAFLIGKWRCLADILIADGSRQTFSAIWTGR